MKLSLALIVVVAFFCSPILAENWPGWRGPRGDGSSIERRAPIEWDGTTGKNVKWKVAIPGSGIASPVIWEDAIILASCITETQERVLIRLERETGALVWKRVVFKAPLESKHQLNSYASGTPATDGEAIYVTFLEVDGRLVPAPNVGNSQDITSGKIVVAAYDFGGNQRWIKRIGKFVSAHGFCANAYRSCHYTKSYPKHEVLVVVVDNNSPHLHFYCPIV